MSIGLWDADKVRYETAPLNLELMKISSYYKRKREIVSLSPRLNPDLYQKFFIRKDYNDGKFPSNLTDYDNIIYGGLAFSNGIYIPLDEAIEEQKPDKYIYEKMRHNMSQKKTKYAAFETMMRAQHLRLSLDEKTIWNKFEKQISWEDQTRTIFLHDNNLQKIDGIHEVIHYLLNDAFQSKLQIYLAMKFPVITRNYSDLEKWLLYPSSFSYYSVQHFGVLEDEQLIQLFINNIYLTNPKKVEYYITGAANDEQDFLDNYIMKIFFQALFFRMTRTKISLKYEQDFFVDKRWEGVISLLNCYISSIFSIPISRRDEVIQKDSLYTFATSMLEKPPAFFPFSKQKVRDLFLFVREKKYELFKLFYDCHMVKLIGGNFEPWKE